MTNGTKIRFGWIKFMYCFTIAGAGLPGLGMILFPEKMIAMNKLGPQDPMMYGIVAGVWFAFGILSVFGLRSPLKFLPVLMMQLCYKSAWIIGVAIPLIIAGKMSPSDPMFFMSILTLIGDLIAIPFPYVFSKQPADSALIPS